MDLQLLHGGQKKQPLHPSPEETYCASLEGPNESQERKQFNHISRLQVLVCMSLPLLGSTRKLAYTYSRYGD